MFAGISNLLWGSSAPAPGSAPAASVPAVGIDDDLCPMEIGSDTGCSDEELVHLPKPNSDGEDDWVVVTEGRGGKKEDPKKKKQDETPMGLGPKVNGYSGRRSGDQRVMEGPEKNKVVFDKTLRVDSKTKKREAKALKVDLLQRATQEPELVPSWPQRAVKTESKITVVEVKSSAEKEPQKAKSLELADIEPKMTKVERKLEKMNLNRTRAEQKRGRVESKLRITNAKRAKGEPQIFEAKTDVVRTETEMVEEVDVANQPVTVTVQPKIVTEELKLVKAEAEIVQEKPKIVVESKPSVRETRSKTAATESEAESVNLKTVDMEAQTKESSESEDTWFQVVHSKHRRHRSIAKATDLVRASNLQDSKREESSVDPDRVSNMRIEPKTTDEVVPEEVKEMNDKTESETDEAEAEMYRLRKSQADRPLPKLLMTRRRRPTRTMNMSQKKMKGDFFRELAKAHATTPSTNSNTTPSTEPTRRFLTAKTHESVYTPRHTLSGAAYKDQSVYTPRYFLLNSAYLEERKTRAIDDDILNILRRARGYMEPKSPWLPARGPRANPYEPMTPVPGVPPKMIDPLTVKPDDDLSMDLAYLCNMLETNKQPKQEEAVKRVMRKKLESRRIEVEMEMNSTKEHEARIAEKELLKEEKKKEVRLTQKAIKPVEHRRLSRKNMEKSNAARHMSSAGNGRLRRSDRLQPRQVSGANNNRKCC